jgi:hypothetical protein
MLRTKWWMKTQCFSTRDRISLLVSMYNSKTFIEGVDNCMFSRMNGIHYYDDPWRN